MNNNISWLKYLITSVIGLAIAYLVVQVRGIWLASNSKDIIEIICDGFFVSGILLTCFGALIFCSSQGAFDGISYIFHVMFVGHNWSKTNFKDRQTYREYVEEKNSKRANGMKIRFVLIVGLVFIAISLIFFAIYSNM